MLAVIRARPARLNAYDTPGLSTPSMPSLRSSGDHETRSPVAEALTEIGLDLSQEFPKPLTDEVVRAADVVITMGCGDSRPLYPGKRYLDWQLDDPAGQPIEAVRMIRDEIDSRVTALLSELLVQPSVPN